MNTSQVKYSVCFSGCSLFTQSKIAALQPEHPGKSYQLPVIWVRTLEKARSLKDGETLTVIMVILIQGCQRSGKSQGKKYFLKVSEKSGNFIKSQGIFKYSQGKAMEKSGKFFSGKT